MDMGFDWSESAGVFLTGRQDSQRATVADAGEPLEDWIPIVNGEELIRAFARRRFGDSQPDAITES